jgi:hypothetical protein
VISGASYSPQVLQGKTQTQIAAALADPNSAIAWAVDGTANLITAAICQITNGQLVVPSVWRRHLLDPVRVTGAAAGMAMVIYPLWAELIRSLGEAEQQTALADVPVTPVFGPGTWRDIHLADQYLRAGETAMTAALPSLRPSPPRPEREIPDYDAESVGQRPGCRDITAVPSRSGRRRQVPREGEAGGTPRTGSPRPRVRPSPWIGAPG